MSERTCGRCGDTVRRRWCETCGADLDPGQSTVLSGHERALAADRERIWLAAQPDANGDKTCPDCAEQVKAAAIVCRFCGHRFDGMPAPAPAAAAWAQPPAQPVPVHVVPQTAEKSPAGAAVLSFLVAGLGHLYLREFGRGILILASVLMVATGFALLGNEAAWLTLPVLAFSARDAYVGANAINDGRAPRQVSGPLWAALGLAFSFLVVGMIVYDESTDFTTSAGRIDVDRVESAIGPDLERQLQDQVPDAVVTVASVSCAAASATEGTCTADVSDDLGYSEPVPISFTVDPDTGEFVWQTDTFDPATVTDP